MDERRLRRRVSRPIICLLTERASNAVLGKLTVMLYLLPSMSSQGGWDTVPPVASTYHGLVGLRRPATRRAAGECSYEPRD